MCISYPALTLFLSSEDKTSESKMVKNIIGLMPTNIRKLSSKL